MHPQAKYFNAFNLIDGIGPRAFEKLLAYFNSLETAWRASGGELIKSGIGTLAVEQIQRQRPKINPDAAFEKLLKEDIHLVTIQDNDYPRLLKEIYAPPAMLYVRGALAPDDSFCVAIVGSRLFSAYGQQAASLISADLARAGLTIVSGLAKGIDALAHRAALDVGGKTIAVLGSGADQQSIYPRANKNLAEEIIAHNGAIISEFPVGAAPLAQHFPQRNRIVSGLSLGVLVVEAPRQSGSLITAQAALEQNRDVFAIPGTIFSKSSEGANNLIKMGAKLVTEADDVLQELNLSSMSQFKENREILPDNEEESLILRQLSKEPIHIDKIVNITKLSTAMVNSTLTLMELKGKVRHLGNGNYVTAF